jgi:hypothetical protein
MVYLCPCGNVKYKGKHVLCRECRNHLSFEKVVLKYGQMKVGQTKLVGNNQAAHVKTRWHASRVMRLAKIEKVCKICGYSNYVEVCHLKALKEFHPDTLLSEVNSLSNIVYMCPNHHKEYDRKIMSVENVDKLFHPPQPVF